MSIALCNKAHEIRANGDDIKVLRICVAGINIEIDCLYGSHFSGFRSYLNISQVPDIVLSVSQEDIDQELLKHPEMKSPNIEVDNNRVAVTFDFGCLEPFVVLRKLADKIIPFGVFLIHGAVVEKDGNAYMFTAPSGTGKTTRIHLWKKEYPDSIVVNGDKPLIKVCSKGIFACGSPWCGKEGWNTNTISSLRAVFLLERTMGNESSSIEEITLGKAFPFLLQQAYYPSNPNLIHKTIKLLSALEGKVKFYRFRSAPTQEAIRLAYETARPR